VGVADRPRARKEAIVSRDHSSMCDRCVDHHPSLSFCKECEESIDVYGNTESDFRFCCFPDCGCDGSRLCMAPEGASEDAFETNVEGLHSRKDTAGQQARIRLLGLVSDRRTREPKAERGH
jgi:hypothetical protein